MRPPRFFAASSKSRRMIFVATVDSFTAKKGANTPEGTVEAMLRLLAAGSLCKCRTMTLHYLLGKVYDRCGRYGDAFAHFALANHARAELAGRFDVGEWQRDVEARISVFNAHMIAELSEHGCHDDFLTCVVGMPRSGTTLVEQILSSQPDVMGLGERKDFARLTFGMQAQLRSRHRYPLCCKAMAPSDVRKLSHSLREQLAATAGPCRRVVTKLPGDMWDLGLIKIFFPRARFVYCRRHPIDTCLSCYMQNFSQITFATRQKSWPKCIAYIGVSCATGRKFCLPVQSLSASTSKQWRIPSRPSAGYMTTVVFPTTRTGRSSGIIRDELTPRASGRCGARSISRRWRGGRITHNFSGRYCSSRTIDPTAQDCSPSNGTPGRVLRSFMR